MRTTGRCPVPRCKEATVNDMPLCRFHYVHVRPDLNRRIWLESCKGKVSGESIRQAIQQASEAL